MTELRIGVTTRETRHAASGDTRDAISRDWAGFIGAALPEALWMPVPNVGPTAREYAQRWGLNGFIFTGGEDYTGRSVRDVTEKGLLELALENKYPVYGVCRGMQFFQIYFGGSLVECPGRSHVSARHAVTFVNTGKEERATVNSFHRWGMRADGLAPALKPFAITDDGFVEGVNAPDNRLMATMWHPERESPFARGDIGRLQALFLS
ncbi:MAG: gamma-glutamyl-gamma-aminobutyrate hydrolase family protein [Nitrospinae bacterium]|nr:gamma-glutamyl-gamma-aminobutyrate hydrolase family protein [Nitrospinota bacterium]